MLTDEQKKRLFDSMDAERLAVIASVDEQSKPEAALIGFAQTPELELIFGTLATNRKYNNIKRNPNVAFVIGHKSPWSIQYEGRAQEMDGEKKKYYQQLHVKKHPGVAKFLSDPDERCFLVHPRWIRYVDIHQPENCFEAEF